MAEPENQSKEQHDTAEKQRKRRNVAIALMVTTFVVLIYLVTLLRLGGSVAERPF